MDDAAPRTNKLIKAISSRWFIYPVIILLACFFFAWQLSNLLIIAHREPPGAGPDKFSIPFTKVVITTADKQDLHGWWIKGKNGKSLILCHGIGAEKSQMVNYASFLYRAGYSVLMFDFRGHGENKPAFISIGYAEKWDLDAAIAYLRERGETRIGLLGLSMGASVCLRSASGDPGILAVVADSPFATLNGMLRYRARELGIPYWPAVPLVKELAHLRTGFNFDEVCPAEDVKKMKCPLFLIHGLSDDNIPPSNSQIVFAAANEPKELLLVPGAYHVEAHCVVQKEYEAKVITFFNKYMK